MPAGQIALEGAQGRFSYGALTAEVERRAAGLAAEGVIRLGLLLDNGIEFLLWDLAAQERGIACVPLPLFFSEAQREHALAAAGVDGLLVQAGPVQSRLLRREPHARADLPAATSRITFTSGTTGTPKGVCLSAAHQWTVADSVAQVARPLAPQRHLCTLPLAVLLENVAGAYAALLSGATVRVEPLAQLGWRPGGFDGAAFLSRLRASGADSVILFPEMLRALVEALEREPARGPATLALKLAAVGGAHVPRGLLERAAALGLPVLEGYGLSECASVVSLNRPGEAAAGVGRALPHVQVELAADGEILVNGPLFLGYLGEGAPPPAPLATGDLGAMDADGRVSITGRKKHLFITSFGRNVSPEWVEAELRGEAEIAHACVFGEGLAACVAVLVPREAATGDAQLGQAVARANARLPDYARIGRWLRADAAFTAATGELTGNARLVRPAIFSRYAARLGASLAPCPA